jgi:SAM-dependent methyltransferase
MIDAAATIDVIKLRFYVDWLYQNHIYPEGDSGFHKELTAKVVKDYVDPLKLSKTAKILDLGCGPGYFLDEMKKRKYKNVVGITLSDEDVDLCMSKGHTVEKHDFSFLPQSQGYDDNSVDFIFLRHTLEHSPYPIITLMEYNRILKQDSKIYIEVPAPDCERKHEWNLNHYSIFGPSQLIALLQRTGFDIDKFQTMEFDLSIGEDVEKVREQFYCVVATKKRSLDVK